MYTDGVILDKTDPFYTTNVCHIIVKPETRRGVSDWHLRLHIVQLCTIKMSVATKSGNDFLKMICFKTNMFFIFVHTNNWWLIVFYDIFNIENLNICESK